MTKLVQCLVQWFTHVQYIAPTHKTTLTIVLLQKKIAKIQGAELCRFTVAIFLRKWCIVFQWRYQTYDFFLVEHLYFVADSRRVFIFIFNMLYTSTPSGFAVIQFLSKYDYFSILLRRTKSPRRQSFGLRDSQRPRLTSHFLGYLVKNQIFDEPV